MTAFYLLVHAKTINQERGLKLGFELDEAYLVGEFAARQV